MPFPSDRIEGSPSTFNVQFQKPWDILRPRFYRFMQKNYVDDFFETGALRLSSFTAFKAHADEQRRDANEGFGLRWGVGQNATIAMVGGRGADCYVLCGSTAGIQSVAEVFPDCDSCLVISDTLSFGASVASAIPHFKGGMEGPAIYKDDLTILRDIGTKTIDEIMNQHKNSDGTISMSMLSAIHQDIGGIEEFFVKHSSFSKQSEYRILWAVEGTAEEYLHIKVPSARQFCRRLDL